MKPDVTMAELRTFFPGLAAMAEATIRNPLNPETAEWLDGPSFARWLDDRGLVPNEHVNPSLWHQINDWRRGQAVQLATADRLLCDVGYHLNDVPVVVWRHPPRKAALRIPKERWDEILALYRKGIPASELAERYEVSSRGIRQRAQRQR